MARHQHRDRQAAVSTSNYGIITSTVSAFDMA
jgi:hypothetical protein